jgi:hypothetical protein
VTCDTASTKESDIMSRKHLAALAMSTETCRKIAVACAKAGFVPRRLCSNLSGIRSSSLLKNSF